jgi:hypothetical protein
MFDRATIPAFVAAGASLTASLLVGDSIERMVRHAVALIVPLALIAFPEIADAAFRRSWSGFTFGGEGPTPATMIRVGAGVLLVVFIGTHHFIKPWWY